MVFYRTIARTTSESSLKYHQIDCLYAGATLTNPFAVIINSKMETTQSIRNSRGEDYVPTTLTTIALPFTAMVSFIRLPWLIFKEEIRSFTENLYGRKGPI